MSKPTARISKVKDKRAIKKMQKTSAEIDSGKRKLVPLEIVLEKYGLTKGKS